MRIIRVILPTTIIIFLLVYFSFFIEINSIECESTQDDCPEIILASLQDLTPDTSVKVRRKINEVLTNNGIIKDHDIRYRFPNTFMVHVVERKPEFSIRTKEEDSWYSVVDPEGMVITVEKETELEYVFADQVYNPGEQIKQETLKAYMIYKHIKPYFNIVYSESRKDSLFVETSRGFQALIPYDNDLELSVGAFLVIFNRLNTLTEKSIIDNRDYEMFRDLCTNGCLIDFRFQNPVIKDKI